MCFDRLSFTHIHKEHVHKAFVVRVELYYCHRSRHIVHNIIQCVTPTDGVRALGRNGLSTRCARIVRERGLTTRAPPTTLPSSAVLVGNVNIPHTHTRAHTLHTYCQRHTHVNYKGCIIDTAVYYYDCDIIIH